MAYRSKLLKQHLEGYNSKNSLRKPMCQSSNRSNTLQRKLTFSNATLNSWISSRQSLWNMGLFLFWTKTSLQVNTTGVEWILEANECPSPYCTQRVIHIVRTSNSTGGKGKLKAIWRQEILYFVCGHNFWNTLNWKKYTVQWISIPSLKETTKRRFISWFSLVYKFPIENFYPQVVESSFSSGNSNFEANAD